MNLKTKFYILVVLFGVTFGLIKYDGSFLNLFHKRTTLSSLHLYNSKNKIENRYKIEKSFMENRDSILSLISHTKYPVLIYRYSIENCQSCIVEDLSALNILKNVIGHDNIVVFPAMEETRYNKLLYSNQLSNFRHRNLASSILFVPMDEDGFAHRYFAIINKDEMIEGIFFPELGNLGLTEAYLSEFKRYFIN